MLAHASGVRGPAVGLLAPTRLQCPRDLRQRQHMCLGFVASCYPSGQFAGRAGEDSAAGKPVASGATLSTTSLHTRGDLAALALARRPIE